MNMRVPQSATAVTRRTLWDDFREGSEFFMQEGAIYETLRRLWHIAQSAPDNNAG